LQSIYTTFGSILAPEREYVSTIQKLFAINDVYTTLQKNFGKLGDSLEKWVNDTKLALKNIVEGNDLDAYQRVT
jgi:hypothetical protein